MSRRIRMRACMRGDTFLAKGIIMRKVERVKVTV
jgi:hypothetical protein